MTSDRRYDFPDKVGYVAPEVILLINNMQKTEDHNRKDVYVRKDVTVSVTCKSKYNCGSSSTSWANDMYSTRMEFPKEHEVTDFDLVPELPRDNLTHCIIFLYESFSHFS